MWAVAEALRQNDPLFLTGIGTGQAVAPQKMPQAGINRRFVAGNRIRGGANGAGFGVGARPCGGAWHTGTPCLSSTRHMNIPLLTTNAQSIGISGNGAQKVDGLAGDQGTDLPPLQATPPGLYRHYKGGWYSVLRTVRCSESLLGMTLYRALYGAAGWWVRPSAMFNEHGLFNGQHQARFVRHAPRQVNAQDLPTARALVAYLQQCASDQGLHLAQALRAPPPEPPGCCERGCDGCVWDGHYQALANWRDAACKLLGD